MEASKSNFLNGLAIKEGEVGLRPAIKENFPTAIKLEGGSGPNGTTIENDNFFAAYFSQACGWRHLTRRVSADEGKKILNL